jgi:hypothetical protein
MSQFYHWGGNKNLKYLSEFSKKNRNNKSTVVIDRRKPKCNRHTSVKILLHYPFKHTYCSEQTHIYLKD